MKCKMSLTVKNLRLNWMQSYTGIKKTTQLILMVTIEFLKSTASLSNLSNVVVLEYWKTSSHSRVITEKTTLGCDAWKHKCQTM